MARCIEVRRDHSVREDIAGRRREKESRFDDVVIIGVDLEDVILHGAFLKMTKSDAPPPTRRSLRSSKSRTSRIQTFSGTLTLPPSKCTFVPTVVIVTSSSTSSPFPVVTLNVP